MKCRCLVVFFCLCHTGYLYSAIAISHKIDKAFEALNQYNYFDARLFFEKSEKNYPCLSNYGLSVIFFRSDNPFHQVDSAYTRIQRSIVAYQNPSKSEISKLLEYAIDGNKLQETKTGIEKLAFQKAVNTGDVSVLNHFLQIYTGAAGYKEALRKRDSIAFSIAKKENSSMGYRQFTVDYPDSYLYPEAKSRYEKTLYDESVFDGQESSYARFINTYPNSPHVGDAMAKLYSIYTKDSNDPEIYYSFTIKYPTNIHVEDAWQKLFDINLVSFNESNINSFLARYPDYPEREKLSEELKLLIKIVLPFKEGQLTGLMDEEGKTLMEARYDFIGRFHEGIAIITRNGKSGFINKKGEEIIPPFYDDAENFSNNLAVVGEANKYGAIVRNGRMVVPLMYDEIDDFSEGYAAASDGNTFGYISRSGSVVIPFQFQFGGAFTHGNAICQLNDLYGVIDIQGKPVIPFKYDEVEIFTRGIFEFTLNDKKGLMSRDGTILLEPVYDEIGPLHFQRALVVKSGQLGYVNEYGRVVIAPGYDVGKDALTRAKFQNNLAVLRKKNKAGVIDSAGNQIIPFLYEDLNLIADTIIAVKQGGKWGLLNLSSGKILLAPKYDNIQSMNGNFMVVVQKGRSGVIDIKGKVVLPFDFQSLIWMNSETLAGKKNGKYGAVNLAGQELILFEADQFEEKEENYFEFSSPLAVFWFDAVNSRIFMHQ